MVVPGMGFGEGSPSPMGHTVSKALVPPVGNVGKYSRRIGREGTNYKNMALLSHILKACFN
jgi:hypothetical protein